MTRKDQYTTLKPSNFDWNHEPCERELWTDLHNPCNPQAKLAGTFLENLSVRHISSNEEEIYLKWDFIFEYLALKMPDNRFEAYKY